MLLEILILLTPYKHLTAVYPFTTQKTMHFKKALKHVE